MPGCAAADGRRRDGVAGSGIDQSFHFGGNLQWLFSQVRTSDYTGNPLQLQSTSSLKDYSHKLHLMHVYEVEGCGVVN